MTERTADPTATGVHTTAGVPAESVSKRASTDPSAISPRTSREERPPITLPFAILLPLIFLAVLLLLNLFHLDRPLAEFCRANGPATVANNRTVEWVTRLPGHYGFVLVCSTILLVRHAQTWRSAGLVALTAVAGIINFFLKWIAGRSRPFRWAGPLDWDAFHDGWPGLIHQHDLSFASGDATLAFAWATAMTVCLPRWRTAFYTAAVVTSAQRVVSTDHYLTDALFGAILGVVTVRVLFRILSRLIPLADVPPAVAPTDSPARTP